MDLAHKQVDRQEESSRRSEWMLQFEGRERHALYTRKRGRLHNPASRERHARL